MDLVLCTCVGQRACETCHGFFSGIGLGWDVLIEEECSDMGVGGDEARFTMGWEGAFVVELTTDVMPDFTVSLQGLFCCCQLDTVGVCLYVAKTQISGGTPCNDRLLDNMSHL
jgi:hypothetical protein